MDRKLNYKNDNTRLIIRTMPFVVPNAHTTMISASKIPNIFLTTSVVCFYFFKHLLSIYITVRVSLSISINHFFYYRKRNGSHDTSNGTV